MPGRRSLEAGEYYAHPQNFFWDIMGELFGANRTLEYKKRLKKLKDNGVALWDVAFKCVRIGSLDAAIKTGSVIPNDLEHFLVKHPHVETIFFNGRKVKELFKSIP